MKNKTIILVLFLIISLQLVNAQHKQFNTWFFGSEIGLDFNVAEGTPPNPLEGVHVQSFYSNPAIWCDRTAGSVQFYTDGMSVWNYMGAQQLVSLTGSSATQPVVIIPQHGAGNENDFYIITTPYPSASKGGEAEYTEVHYEATGDITEVSSVVFSGDFVGKVAATINDTKDGYWVVLHTQSSEDFIAYLIDQTGIATTKTSNVEPTYGDWNTQENLTGFFKISPSGQYLASTSIIEGRVDIYNFDIATGVITEHSTYSITNSYGIEFSPNEEYLYVGQSQLFLENKIFQIDIINGGAPSQIGTGGENDRSIGALQLAPDGKIYVAHSYGMTPPPYNDYVGAIENPNNVVCNFDKDAINLGAESNNVLLSLPSVPSNLVLPPPPIDFQIASGNCAGSETVFQILGDMTGVTSVSWEFDDGNNSPNDVSTDTDPTYTFWSGGTHLVQLTIWHGSTPTYIQHDVVINGPHINDIINPSADCGAITIHGDYVGVDPYDYYWENTITTGTANSETFFIDNIGNNHIIFELTDNSICTAHYEKDFVVEELPTLTFNPANFEACDEVTLAPSYTSNGNTNIYWSLDGGSSIEGETYTVTVAGTHTVVAQIFDDFCSNTYTETVIVNESPTLDMGADISACDTITLDVNNMTIIANSPTYQWSIISGSGTAQGETFFVDGVGPNIIELTVTDENDCSDSDMLDIYINESPNIDLGPDIQCATNEIELSITDSPDYQEIYWSNFQCDGFLSCTVRQTGEYWIEVVDMNSCVGKDTIEVTFAECQQFDLETTLNTINVDNYLLVCDGNKNISLTSSPNFINNDQCYTQELATTQFFWDMGDGTLFDQPDVNYTYNDYGSYEIFLVAVDNQNCKSRRNFLVEISQTPFVSSTDKVACLGETIDIVAGREGEGNDLDIILDLFETTYPLKQVYSQTAIIPDNAGTYQSTINIYDNNEYIIQDASDISGFYIKMEHSDITNFNDFKIICPTGSEITLMDLSLAGEQMIAGEPIMEDDASPQMGNGYDFYWSENSNFSVSDLITEGIPQKYYIDPNSNEYGYVGFLPARTYKPFDAFSGFVGCPINGEWKLAINDAQLDDNGFVIEWGVEFNSGRLFKGLNIEEGEWTGNNIIDYPNDSTIVVEAINAGNLVYTLNLTDYFGCLNSESITLSTEELILELGNDTTICFNQDIELDADGGNIGTISYEWNTNETTSAITVNEAGTYSVTVTGEACEASDYVIINVAPELIVDLGSDLTLCFNKSVELIPNTITDITYNWNTGEITETITITEGGEYWVEIGQENCKNSDTIFINGIPELKAFLGKDTTICEGQEIEISPKTTENVSFTWNTNETNSTIIVSEDGEYWVEIMQESCIAKDTIKINVAPAINLELGEDITIFTGDQITLNTGIEDAIYLWQPTEETTQSISVSEAGLYVVTVTKACSVSDSITVYVDDIQIIIPNTFTPNGDGINDTWQFGNAENLGEINVNIFDRLGNIMTNYTSTENPLGWDGTHNNFDLPSDTFWYIIKFENGETQSGTVTIRR